MNPGHSTNHIAEAGKQQKRQTGTDAALVALVRLLAREAARQVVEDATACFEANLNTHSDERK